MWGFCGCNRRHFEPEREEVRDEREWVTVRKPCKRDDHKCDCHKRKEENTVRNTSVSPSSFCQRQLAAAENGCRANPLTNFSRCRRTF